MLLKPTKIKPIPKKQLQEVNKLINLLENALEKINKGSNLVSILEYFFSQNNIEQLISHLKKESENSYLLNSDILVIEKNISSLKKKVKAAPKPAKKNKGRGKKAQGKQLPPQVNKSLKAETFFKDEIDLPATIESFPTKIELLDKAVATLSPTKEDAYLMDDIRYYTRVLGSALELLNVYQKNDQECLQQEALFPILRSISILTEQLLLYRNTENDLNHMHTELIDPALPKAITDCLYTDINFGAVATRYPHQVSAFDEEHRNPSVTFTQWLNDPTLVDFTKLSTIIQRVSDFIILQNPLADLSALFDLAPIEESSPLPVEEKWESAFTSLDEISATIQARLISFNITDIEKMHWLDAQFHAEGLRNGINSLKKYPETKVLLAQGDRILTHLQFLWEQIETAQYIQRNGKILQTHNLKEFENLKLSPMLSSQQLEVLQQMNISYGAQYPHRYIRNKQITHAILKTKKALSWRLDASVISFYSRNIDEGLIQIKGKKSSHLISPHGLATLKKDLHQLTLNSLDAIRTISI
jgi:hypothetical protein